MTKITRLFDFPYYQLDKQNLLDALVTKQDGVWVKTSTKEYIDKANTISRALLRMGIQKNDKIAVISTNNRTEWNIMDIGVLQTGAQNVPIYPTISEDDYQKKASHNVRRILNYFQIRALCIRRKHKFRFRHADYKFQSVDILFLFVEGFYIFLRQVLVSILLRFLLRDMS